MEAKVVVQDIKIRKKSCFKTGTGSSNAAVAKKTREINVDPNENDVEDITADQWLTETGKLGILFLVFFDNFKHF